MSKLYLRKGLTVVFVIISVVLCGIGIYLFDDNLSGEGVSARASESSGLSYTAVSGGYSVAIGTCTASDIVIPETYFGQKVVSIAYEGFKQSNIRSVSIPESVTEIGEMGFYNCPNITEITLPEGVVTIKNGAFRACTSLVTVNLPNTLKTIGMYPFGSCRQLKNIHLPSSLQTIERQAFEYCSALPSIEIPSSVTYIGSSAFSGCTALKTITMNSTAVTNTSSSTDPFYNCKGVAAVYLPYNTMRSLPFFDNDGDCLLVGVGIYVPSALYQSYKANANWSGYEIKSHTFSAPAISGVENEKILKVLPSTVSVNGTCGVQSFTITYPNNSVQRVNGVSFKIPSNAVCGKYTINATSYSGSQSTLSFIYDNVSPNISIVQGSQSCELINEMNINFTSLSFEQVDDNADCIYIDGTNKYEGGTVVLENGSHTITATDKAGNTTTRSFYIDDTAPCIQFIQNGVACNLVDGMILNVSSLKLCDVDDSDVDIVLDVVTQYNGGSISLSNGTHTLTATDAANNVTEITFYVDTILPEIEGLDSSLLCKGGDILFFKDNFDDSSLFSNFIAGQAIEKVEFISTSGDSYAETQILDGVAVPSFDGRYSIIVKDRAGNKNIKTITIDSTKPTITGYDETLTYTNEVTLQAKDLSGILSIKVGTTSIAFDDEGMFCVSTPGQNVISVIDKAGNKSTLSIYIDNPTTTTVFSCNVINRGITNQSVVFNTGEQGLSIQLLKDNVSVECQFNSPISGDGKYQATITDASGNVTIYTFEIITQPLKNFVYVCPEGFSICEYKQNGESQSWATGIDTISLAEDAVHTVSVVSDEDSSITYSWSVTIDTIPPEVELEGVQGEVTNKTVKIGQTSESALMQVYKDGEIIDASINSALREDGDYRIILSDVTGNKSEYAFKIEKHINEKIVVIGVIAGIVLATAAFLIRKVKIKHIDEE